MTAFAVTQKGKKMDDLISRQVVIGLIRGMYPSPPIFPSNRRKWEEKYEPFIRVEREISNLPSAQPAAGDDLVSREAVKKWLELWDGYIDMDIVRRMQYRVIDIPSAQPEIIRCKDCKYAKWDDERRDYICNGRAVWENHYCGYAKRKGEDDETD